MTTQILFLAFTLAACGDKDDTGDTGNDTDGGAADGGASDGGSSDGGSSDGGSSDGGSSDGGAEVDIEVMGSWIDSWGSDHQITNESWTSYGGSSIAHISQYDNDLDFAIAQNDEANEYSPGLWSRFDWTVDDRGGLWYCQTAYAAESETAALETPRADDSDPATTGCGGSFSWSQLTPAR